MKTTMKKILAAVLALCMVLSLAACGGSSAGTSDSGNSGTSGGGSSSSAPAVNNDSDGNGRVDKVVYASTQAYTSLVPFLNPKTYTAAVFEPLGSFQTYGEGFEGLLMESWEYDGDRTYTVKLYENIYDSEGNHITASDVEFCYEAVKGPGSEMANMVKPIESVTATGDYTVEFVWADKPVIGAFEHFTSYVNIVSQAAYEASGDGMASKPVGTGPYVVDSWTSGVTMTLKVNENYWASGDQVKFDRQQQPVDEIEIQTISETSQLSMALQTGVIDMTADIASQDVPNFTTGQYADKYTVEETTATAPKSLLVNQSPNAKTSDENLVKAIMCALDQEFVASMVNGGANVATYGLGAPCNPDYDAETFKSYLPEHDLEKAKEYLAQSAYPNGTDINLLFIEGGISNDIAEAIQGQLAQIGITVNIKSEIFPNWLASKNDDTAWELNMSELSGFYVTDLWESAFVKQNEIFANDEQLAELHEMVGKALDVNTHSQETVNAAQKYITEHGYCIPLLVQIKYNVYNNSLIESIAYTGEGAVCVQGFSYK
ncbi:MAG: ABC transporter substrate-binding protein [Faecousia sp.]